MNAIDALPPVIHTIFRIVPTLSFILILLYALMLLLEKPALDKQTDTNRTASSTDDIVDSERGNTNCKGCGATNDRSFNKCRYCGSYR